MTDDNSEPMTDEEQAIVEEREEMLDDPDQHITVEEARAYLQQDESDWIGAYRLRADVKHHWLFHMMLMGGVLFIGGMAKTGMLPTSVYALVVSFAWAAALASLSWLFVEAR